jgi:hypothetical protein
MATEATKEIEDLEREIQELLKATRAENEALKRLIEALDNDELMQKNLKNKYKTKNR